MTSFNRYFLISAISLLIDLSIFIILYSLEAGLFKAAIISRIISSIFNFSFNKYYVFKSSNRSTLANEVFMYIFFSISLTLLSASIINAMGFLSVIVVSSSKFLLDTFLFVINFFLQKKIIFKK